MRDGRLRDDPRRSPGALCSTPPHCSISWLGHFFWFTRSAFYGKNDPAIVPAFLLEKICDPTTTTEEKHLLLDLPPPW